MYFARLLPFLSVFVLASFTQQIRAQSCSLDNKQAIKDLLNQISSQLDSSTTVDCNQIVTGMLNGMLGALGGSGASSGPSGGEVKTQGYGGGSSPDAPAPSPDAPAPSPDAPAPSPDAPAPSPDAPAPAPAGSPTGAGGATDGPGGGPPSPSTTFPAGGRQTGDDDCEPEPSCEETPSPTKEESCDETPGLVDETCEEEGTGHYGTTAAGGGINYVDVDCDADGYAISPTSGDNSTTPAPTDSPKPKAPGFAGAIPESGGYGYTAAEINARSPPAAAPPARKPHVHNHNHHRLLRRWMA